MKKRFIKLILINCLINNISFASDINDIHWMFQDTVPYSYADNKTNQNKGMVFDVLNVILKNLGSKTSNADFMSIPFARGLNELRTNKNIAFFLVAKSPERVSEFKWVGPIAEYTPVIWAKKSKKITPKEVMSALRTHTIGTKSNSIINKLIMDQGFDGSNIYQDTLDSENIKKLYYDRIDLVACDYIQGIFIFRELGYNLDDYEVIYHLPKFDYSIAFSEDVSDDLITKIQNNLDALKTSNNGISEYDIIMNNYK